MRGAASGAAARVGGLARRRGLSDGSGGGSRAGAGGGWDRSNLDHTLFFFARLPREQHTRAMWIEEAVLWGTCCQRARAADAVRRSVCGCTALTRFATPTVSARAKKKECLRRPARAPRGSRSTCAPTRLAWRDRCETGRGPIAARMPSPRSPCTQPCSWVSAPRRVEGPSSGGLRTRCGRACCPAVPRSPPRARHLRACLQAIAPLRAPRRASRPPVRTLGVNNRGCDVPILNVTAAMQWAVLGPIRNPQRDSRWRPGRCTRAREYGHARGHPPRRVFTNRARSPPCRRPRRPPWLPSTARPRRPRTARPPAPRPSP